MTTFMKLNPGQYVTADNMRRAYRITTVRSYTMRKNHETLWNKYMQDPETQHAAAVKKGHSLAWITNSGFAIVAHDNSEELRIERLRKENATVLQEGDTVQIEGVNYSVRVHGESHSDAIAFITKK